MFVLTIGAVIARVAVALRAMVVAIGRMRDIWCSFLTARIAKKTGERGGHALHRQHYECEKQYESFGGIQHKRAESIREFSVPQRCALEDSGNVPEFPVSDTALA